MANQEPIDVTRAEIEPVSARDGAGQPKPLDRAPHDLSAVEARQGVISGRVVTVLGVSVALAVVGMVLAFTFSS